MSEPNLTHIRDALLVAKPYVPRGRLPLIADAQAQLAAAEAVIQAARERQERWGHFPSCDFISGDPCSCGCDEMERLFAALGDGQ